MPSVLSYGVSYSDFWHMTLREITDFLKFSAEKEKKLLERKEKHELVCAATTAYYAGYFNRTKSFPTSLESAFPKLFGLTEQGAIPVENWQAGLAQMHAIAAQHNAEWDRKKVASKK